MVKKAVSLIGVFILLGAAAGAVWFFVIIQSIPDPDLLTNRQVFESTKIYDRTGEILLYEIHGEEKRTNIPFENIPDYVKQATIAVEDEAFYQHQGYDIFSILNGAIVEPLLGKRDRARGGSTITQQLAKNAFLSDERTITRKVRELILAVQLEKSYTKDEILELYLNQIPYGANAYGIEAAAQTFFEKTAGELTLAEAALLASLPNAPSYYSPWGHHVDELLSRKDFIIEKLYQLGDIDEEERDRAKALELTFAERADTIRAPHFVIAVQEELNNRYGEEFVQTAGLEVITTLDWELQQIAEKAVEEGVARNEELYDGRNGALVAQDPKTGEILALVGSRDYFDVENEGNFNVATQGLRQPGSTMKPFAYITAFTKGFTPETILFDLPTEFAANNPACPIVVDFTNTHEECYHPENFDGVFRGPVSMREALSQSINVPSIKTLYLAGLDDTLELARAFGLKTLTERSRYGLSLVLGGGEVRLIDLVGAYSVLAQDGTKTDQVMILKVSRKQSRGEKVLEEHTPQSNQVIDEEYVHRINDILTDIESRSALFSSSLPLTIFPNHEVALKTGTTNDYRDAWAIGYTPSLVVGVWAGNNDNTPMKQRGSSLLAAIPMWNAFLREALPNTPSEFFERPPIESPQKPALRGDLIVDNEVHSILYYTNKNNPRGPVPENPERDSQFINWEEPIRLWVENNVNFLTSLVQNRLIEGKTQIAITTPTNGSFIVNNQLRVAFSAQSTIPLARYEISLNDLLLDSGLIAENNFTYDRVFTAHGNSPQSELTISVTDSNNQKQEEVMILFR